MLDEHPEIELVLSSSWRIDYGIERARELLPARHRLRLVGETPVAGSSADRGSECLRWLAGREDCLFAAVDDCRQLFVTAFKWLALANARTGIEDESILALKQILRLPT